MLNRKQQPLPNFHPLNTLRSTWRQLGLQPADGGLTALARVGAVHVVGGATQDDALRAAGPLDGGQAVALLRSQVVGVAVQCGIALAGWNLRQLNAGPRACQMHGHTGIAALVLAGDT